VGDSYVPLLFLVVMAAGFWLLIVRPAKARARAHEQVVRSLGPGARIMLASGIFGTVVEAGEGQLQVEIAPGVVVTVVDQAVAQVVTTPEAPDGGPGDTRPGTSEPPASSSG